MRTPREVAWTLEESVVPLLSELADELRRYGHHDTARYLDTVAKGLATAAERIRRAEEVRLADLREVLGA